MLGLYRVALHKQKGTEWLEQERLQGHEETTFPLVVKLFQELEVRLFGMVLVRLAGLVGVEGFWLHWQEQRSQQRSGVGGLRLWVVGLV